MSIEFIKSIKSECTGNDNSDRCKISHNQRYIILSGKSILLYDTVTNITKYISKTDVDEWNMCFSHNDKYIAYIDTKKDAHIYSIDMDTEIPVSLTKCAKCVYFSDDDKYLFVGVDKAVVFYDIINESYRTVELQHTVDHFGQFGVTLYCSNYKRCFSTICIMDLKATHMPWKNMFGGDDYMYWSTIMYNDKIMYETHSYGYTYVEIHDITKNTTYFADLSSPELICLKDYKRTLGGFIIRGLKFVDDETVVYGGDCGSVNVWNFVKGPILTLPINHTVYDVLPINKSHIAYISESKLHIWSLDDSKIIDSNIEFEGSTEYCYLLNKNCLVTNNVYKSISFWKLEGGRSPP